MDTNPYESPASHGTPSPRKRRSVAAIAFVILIVLATLPAAAIAFFTVCLVIAGPRLGVADPRLGLIFGSVAGIMVVVSMLWWAIVISRPTLEPPQSELPRRWTRMDGTFIDATLVSLERDEVNLLQRDGAELRVPLSQLSVADRVWLEVRR